MSKICVSRTIHVSRPNLAKIGRCEVAEKSSRIAYKKNPASGIFSPPLNQSRPKFREQKSEYNIGYQPTIITKKTTISRI